MIKDCKGFASVFLCIVFAGFIVLIGTCLDSLGKNSSKAHLERSVHLASKSVLSEYDIDLKNDYGIFGLPHNQSEIEKKIAGYLDLMGKNNLFSLTLKEINVDTAGYGLINPNAMQRQMVECMKLELVGDIVGDMVSGITDITDFGKASEWKGIISEAKKENNIGQGDITNEGSGGVSKQEVSAQEKNVQKSKAAYDEKAKEQVGNALPQDGQEEGKVLRNLSIIEGLPSKGWKGSLRPLNFDDISLESLEQMDVLKGIYGKAKEELLVNEYIIKYTNNHYKKDKKESFFTNEAEYILYGDFYDQKNYKAFLRELMALRIGLNMLHIYGDTQKRNETLEVAISIAGASGPGALALQLAIITAWASMEARADLDIIKNNGKIPLVKREDQWGTSLAQILNAREVNHQNGYEEGLDYQGYLKIFLLKEDNTLKVLRMMDVIQINMKGRYHEGFHLKNYYEQFDVALSSKREQHTLKLLESLGMGNKVEVEGHYQYERNDKKNKGK